MIGWLRKPHFRYILTTVFAAATSCCAAEEQLASGINFRTDIYSVLRKACFECHGPGKQSGDLRIDLPKHIQDSGVIVPGKPDESELLRRISLPHGHDEVMPAIGRTLPAKQIAAIRKWILEGAQWPESFEAGQHWSYVKPVRPEVPDASDATAWAVNAIDLFVADRLRKEGLHPSPPADAQTLIRRVYLVLIGLPPTPAEVRSFVADPTNEAYEEIVHDLLGRPQFGERWARPWLDLARYADSHGFQRDNFRDIWPYRDWVIRALNDDMPFDQFTMEQIAGDLLPNATESQKIATGFHRCTPTNVEAGSLPEETRIEQVIDRVNTTGAVWLGTTLECCQCHDHKYDPFSMGDYYRLLAYFNSTEAEAARTDPQKASSIRFRGPTMPVSNPKKDSRRTKAQKELAALKTTLAAHKQQLNEGLKPWVLSLRDKGGGLLQHTVPGDTGSQKTADTADSDSVASEERSAETISPEAAAALKKPSGSWTSEDRRALVKLRQQLDPKFASLTKRVEQRKKEVEKLAADTTLVMIELSEPRSSYIFERGDYRHRGSDVQAGTPHILHSSPRAANDRVALAKWLTDSENPLVARVTVNRWWAELFGQGIVTTPEDFGVKGDHPSHPLLLDWLAVEFMENGWSMKHLLKTIAMSATFRQSSHTTESQIQHDPGNRLLGRGPRFRMDAEMIRDNTLAISGLLNLRQFGPPIRPFQPEGVWSKVGGTSYDYVVSPGSEQHRRGIYVVLKRGAPYPSFINFDASARLACAVERSRTNTPLQALTLLNDPVHVESAKALARRILTDMPMQDDASRLEYAFQLCVSRLPSKIEHEILRQLLNDQIAQDRSEISGSANAVPSADPPAGIRVEEFHAWWSVATALLNLHETITIY